MRKSCDWCWSLNCGLRCRLRNGGVPDMADLAMLLVIRLGVPMAGRVRAQPYDRQDKRDGQETYG